MSTAVLISGQMRTFAQTFSTFRWHVLRHFADPHFFITVQDNPDCASIDLLRAEYGADHVHADLRTDPDFSVLDPGLLSLVSGPCYYQAPYANAASPHQLLLQHWYQNECWKHFQTLNAQLSTPNRQFSTIIRTRGDLWFHSFAPPPNSPPFAYPDIALTPWWGRFGGINDRFAILGHEAARAYFTTYDHIPELLAAGCPFHPESLVAASLERSACVVRTTLRTEFTTFRTNRQHRPPEIAPWDIAHAALRAA